MVIRIYVLSDPRNEDIRYVGKTKQAIEKRLKQHLRDRNNNRRTNWIKSLRKVGVSPTILLIENTDEQNWEIRERYWIKYYRSLGYDLTNLTDGGEGTSNPAPETRARMSEAHKGEKNGNYGKPMPFEQRERLSEIRLAMNTAGWHHRPDTLARMLPLRRGENHYMFGKHHPESTKKKLSDAMSGENHPNFGKHYSEEVIENMRKGHIGQTISEEQKRKTSATLTGVPKTEEHRKNISLGLKGKPKSPQAVANSVAAKKAKREQRKALESACLT